MQRAEQVRVCGEGGFPQDIGQAAGHRWRALEEGGRRDGRERRLELQGLGV